MNLKVIVKEDLFGRCKIKIRLIYLFAATQQISNIEQGI